MISTKPYMLRAIHEWCVDNGYTPHLLVLVNPQTLVPMGYVKNSEIVLNINYSATKDLQLDNHQVTFSARIGGVSQNVYVPMDAVKGIFARENGEGMFFEVENSPVVGVNSSENSNKTHEIKRPILTVVK